MAWDDHVGGYSVPSVPWLPKASALRIGVWWKNTARGEEQGMRVPPGKQNSQLAVLGMDYWVWRAPAFCLCWAGEGRGYGHSSNATTFTKFLEAFFKNNLFFILQVFWIKFKNISNPLKQFLRFFFNGWCFKINSHSPCCVGGPCHRMHLPIWEVGRSWCTLTARKQYENPSSCFTKRKTLTCLSVCLLFCLLSHCIAQAGLKLTLLQCWDRHGPQCPVDQT